MRQRTVIAMIFAIVCLSGPMAEAGLDNILAPGLNPNTTYHVNEFDTVNMLNGDLMLDVPFGPEYKTNGTLKYQFKLHYNGNFWIFFDYFAIDQPPGYQVGLLSYRTAWFDRVAGGSVRGLSDFYDRQVVDTGAAPSAGHIGSEAVPTGNAGAGWQFDMGSFGADPVNEYFTQGGYFSPDGSAVSFGAYVHSDGVPPVAERTKPDAYSRDDRFLRMREVASPDVPRREVDFPDGIVKHFKCVRGCATGGPEWNLEWIADPFGNVLKITRVPEVRPNVGNWVWTFTETRVSANPETRSGNAYYKLGDATAPPIRTHKLTFNIAANVPGGAPLPNNSRYLPIPELRTRLLSAELAGPTGQPMTYSFQYNELEVMRTIVRPWVVNSDLLYPYTSPSKIKIWVLDRIVAPAGGGFWKFNYYQGTSNDGTGLSYRWCIGGNNDPNNCTGTAVDTSKVAGRIRSVESPMGGGYEYTYERRIFPKRVCVTTNPREGNLGAGITTGVATRRQIGGGAGAEHPVWRYSGSAYPRLFIDYYTRPGAPGKCTNAADCPLDLNSGPDGYDDGDVNKNNFVENFDERICRAPLEFIAAMLEPNGALALNYYNAQYTAQTVRPNGVPGEEYGAPYSPVPTRYDTLYRQVGPPVSRPVSTQLYSVSTAASSPFVTNLWDSVRRLSREYRARDGSEEPSTENLVQLLRSTYRTYDWSRLSCFDSTGNGNYDCAQLNMRVTGEHTRFHDDPKLVTINGNTQPSYVETLYADYDGLGNFRQTNLYGNVRAVNQNNPAYSEWDHRASHTLYNPGVTFNGTACQLDATQCNPAGMPSPTQPWFLSTFKRTTSLEKSEVQTALHRFHPDRGYLVATRTLAREDGGTLSTAPGAPTKLPEDPRVSIKDVASVQSGDDLVVVHERGDDTGQVSVLTDKHWGGDGAGLTAWTDTMYVPGGNPEYAMENRVQYGSLAATSYKGCDAATTYLQAMSATINPSMGLPQQVTDRSGLSTAIQYDGLGRAITATPPGGMTPQTYMYKLASAGDTVNSLTIARAGGGSATYEYDHLGRLSSTTEVMPAGTQLPAGGAATSAVTTYTYTPLDKVATVKSPGSAGTTVTNRYDIFNRLVSTVNAAGDQTTMAYDGVRRMIQTTIDVALNDSNGRGPIQKTHQYDTFGRLIEMDDEIAHATYEYDVQSHIARALLKGSGASNVQCAQPSVNCQMRRFGYDGRGFLMTAEHPELRVTASADNVMVRASYDSRGKVKSRDLAWASGASAPNLGFWSLSYQYDAAERMTGVFTGTGSATKPLKTFWYFPPDAAPGLQNQLRLAVRHNYIPNPAQTRGVSSIAVESEFAYNDCRGSGTGRCGLATSATTRATATKPRVCVPLASCTPGVESDTFLSGVVAYSYDDRGDLRTLGYPVYGSAPGRTITYDYASGRLTGVKQASDTLASIKYHVSGMPRRIDFKRSDVFDEILTYDNGLTRIKKINWHWAQSPASATTGQFAFDGAGNVELMGSDAFKYDKALRLMRATIAGSTEDFTYDVLGNLTKSGVNPQHTYAVDFATNHLTAVFGGISPQTSVTYDYAGNVASMPDGRTLPAQTPAANRRIAFNYDQFNSMTSLDGETLGRVFVYDANDERVAIIDHEAAGGTVETWSFRDTANRVLRDLQRTYNGQVPVWQWKKDYVYRGASLSNIVAAEGVRDVHLDHLGSIRYVSDATTGALSGGTSSGTRYRPFGTLVTVGVLNERPAFTGHERDEDGDVRNESDFDYMHARYYSPMMGRFLSTDPGFDYDLTNPQSWNLYAYVRNSPLGSTDPTGRATKPEEHGSRGGTNDQVSDETQVLDIDVDFLFPYYGFHFGGVEASYSEHTEERSVSYADLSHEMMWGDKPMTCLTCTRTKVVEEEFSIGYAGVGYTAERHVQYSVLPDRSVSSSVLSSHSGVTVGVPLGKHGSPVAAGTVEGRAVGGAQPTLRVAAGFWAGVRIDVGFGKLIDKLIPPGTFSNLLNLSPRCQQNCSHY